MNEYYLFVLSYALFLLFAAASIISTVYSWCEFDETSELLGVVEGKSFLDNLKIVLMIGLPVLSWAVAVTTLIYRNFPAQQKV